MDYGILTMSLAPSDEHQSQVQFALERGLPALLGVLSIHRLTFPSRSFDMVHCSRCLVPWTDYGITLIFSFFWYYCFFSFTLTLNVCIRKKIFLRYPTSIMSVGGSYWYAVYISNGHFYLMLIGFNTEANMVTEISRAVYIIYLLNNFI